MRAGVSVADVLEEQSLHHRSISYASQVALSVERELCTCEKFDLPQHPAPRRGV